MSLERLSNRLQRGMLALIFLVAQAPAAGIVVENVELRDNGDDDGFADTLEAVELRLVLRNSSESDLTGVTVSISTADVDRICLEISSVTVGGLAAGESRLTPPFVFHVADIDRSALGFGPYDELSATFEVSAVASGGSLWPTPSRVTIDLDLDITGGGAPSTYLEDYEGVTGLGDFVGNNLDFGLHDDADPEFGLSDGYRCQYHAPFCTHAICEGDPGFQSCSLGASPAHADAFHFSLDGPASVDGGRAYSGTNSLYFGVPLAAGFGHTTPAGVLEAVESGLPIFLDAYRRCSDEPSTVCDVDTDCGSGASCDPAHAVLSIKHQLSLLDDRFSPGGTLGTAIDRAVVALQLADAAGVAHGPWIKIDPFENGYDQQPVRFNNCTFDPVDDGHTEEDLFPGESFWTPPAFGPSSSCWPESVWAWIGSTAGVFDPAALGHADGPGLSGASGSGTWVESRFDLSRYRGRGVRIRFLASTTRVYGNETHEAAFQFNPDDRDDGWWIDDVTVEHVLTAPAAVAVDSKDNSTLPVPVDTDLDGLGDVCDNCLATPNVDQADADADTIGDLCDDCTDPDADGFGEPGFPASTCTADNCPYLFNPTQADFDSDGWGDACDVCPTVSDPGQADLDADGSGTACDCDDMDESTFPGAPEINDGLDNQCPGDPGYGILDEISGLAGFYNPADRNEFSWPAQFGAGSYTVARAVRPRGGSIGPFCFDFGTSGTSIVDAAVPLTSSMLLYMVRSETTRVGSFGVTSSGEERQGVFCGR